MAVSSLKNKSKLSTLTSPFDIDLGGMIPLSTVAVTSNTATVTFNDITDAYEHLQVRILVRDNRAVSNGNPFSMTINSDSGSNYASHSLSGNGTSASAVGYSSVATINTPYSTSADDAASIFSTFIIDILDYSNTNKYTTVRGLNGFDRNGSGIVTFYSGLWMNTAKVSSLSFFPNGSADIVANSHFALYGIKRAGA